MIDASSPFEILTEGGLIWLFGWFMFAVAILAGFILLLSPPRSGRQVSLVDTYAACLHVQLLIFILCVPLPLAFAAYLTPDPIPDAIMRDMMIGTMALVANCIVSGALLLTVSLRHRKRPTLEWMPAVSVLVGILSTIAAWECRVALAIHYDQSVKRDAAEVFRKGTPQPVAPRRER